MSCSVLAVHAILPIRCLLRLHLINIVPNRSQLSRPYDSVVCVNGKIALDLCNAKERAIN
jgi:hypothetical protein